MRNRLQNITILRNLNNGKRYYKPLKYPLIPKTNEDLYVITTVGDRLDSLAFQFYNDIRLWWIIAKANPETIRRDSFSLKPGLEIRIPARITSILENFDNLNR